MALLLQHAKHLFEQLQLPRCLCHSRELVGAAGTQWCLVLGAREQVGMVTALLQVHHDVQH